MRTEVAIAKYGCHLERRAGHWVVRFHDNPHYWFGNCLIFDAPPGAGDFERWMASFEREHGDSPSDHRVFRIDCGEGVAGEAGPFLRAGFELQRMYVLSARQVAPPPKVNREVEIRPLRTDREWEAALAQAIDVGVHDSGHADTEAYAVFKRARLTSFREMQRRGLGQVWGAFLGVRLVAQLGLFHVGELSRFQQVATDRAYRRRGICGTLVYRVSERALADMPGRRLVMCAMEDYQATQIYQSLGFRIAERVVDYKRPAPS